MSNGLFFAVCVAGICLAIFGLLVAARALRQSKTVEVFERQPQPYMLQADPPSQKVQALSLPKRETDMDRTRERQA